MQAVVRGVTLTVETGPDVVRISVRRAWWTPAGIGAAIGLAICVGVPLFVGGGAWLGAVENAGRPAAPVGQTVFLAVFALGFAASTARWSAPHLLSILCGDESVEVRGTRVTVRRRNPIRRWEKSFDAPGEEAVVVSAARRGWIVRALEARVSTPPLGRVGGLRVDGATSEWECRIAPGLPTETADRLVRALGGVGEWPRLTVPVPAADAEPPAAD